MVKAITGDKKTTVGGIAALVIAVAQLVQAISDGDPSTMPDFNTVGLMILGYLGLVGSDGGRNEKSNFKSNSVGGIR
ncbi:MAG: hypothetical protein ACPGLY_27985 [Rubripirellula sp.]